MIDAPNLTDEEFLRLYGTLPRERIEALLDERDELEDDLDVVRVERDAALAQLEAINTLPVDTRSSEVGSY